MLRPVDIVTALFLVSESGNKAGYEKIAEQLRIGLASAHRSMKRLEAAGLVSGSRALRRSALFELLVHGVRYVYYARPGTTTRGVLTAESARPLNALVAAQDAPWVWPDPEGDVRGIGIEPLHASVPSAVRHDPALYELLALVDAIRVGGARVRRLAEQELRKRVLA